MKKKYLIAIMIFTTVLFICFNMNKSIATQEENDEISEAYKVWLELPAEEKEGKISPRPFSIELSNNKGFINRLNKGLINESDLLDKYNLKDYINIEVKNQLNTNECWAFSANSCIETTLAKIGETYNFSERHLEYSTLYFLRDELNKMGNDRLIELGRKFSFSF